MLNSPAPSDPTKARRLLILGGTREARELAHKLGMDDRWHIISSLAGRTRTPLLPQGETRTGGFGGQDGLRDYLVTNAIEVVADATHPYAVEISARTQRIAADIGIPYLRLERPPWLPGPGDDWRHVTTTPEAARILPTGARVFLTVGRQSLGIFLARRDVQLVARMIEPPSLVIPDYCELILARPPFTITGESNLMNQHAITHLVTKNAGGNDVAPKLAAAHRLHIPVIMIDRPEHQPAASATSVEEMMAQLQSHVG